MQRQSHLLTLPQSPYFCMPESIGHYYDHPDHYSYREAGALNNYNIHYVVSGKGHVEIDGIVHTLGPGDAVLYSPLQEQLYYSSKDDPWNIRWFHFYGESLQTYFVQGKLHRSLIWSLRQTELWEQAHEELLREAAEHRMLRPHHLSTLTYALLTLFVQYATPKTSGKAGLSGNRITRLLPLMQQEATRPFELDYWAEQAQVTPHYFCKLFKSAMQMTPMDFITRCRLQTAKQWLLERRTASIGQIAMEAGYPSVSYFNKRFLSHEGMTPTAYRQIYETSERL
ncbi:helix-turn-helix domain-containing protein [Paenibacillus sp. HB172176]|uniref:helix-turn-helix transcriptional regulator n=1 Tax=Paenibacillus sp. HB172176 TaxID=2493690 RepID=UPI0014387192|nr:helix-turn-helix domain-containing protein [Paenibacillus sp. HB172176]